MRKLRALAVVLSMLMVISVCSGFSLFGKTVTIQFIANNVSNDKSVVTAVNKRLKELGLDFKVKFVWDTWEPRQGQRALDQGDRSIDIVWAASWPQSFNLYALKGSFVKLDDMLTDYPDLKKAVPQALWDVFTAAGVDGERGIYAVPVVKEAAQTYSWDVNNTMLEELGYSFDDFEWDRDTLYDPEFEALLKKAKAEKGADFYPLMIEAEPFIRHVSTSENDPTGLGMIYFGYDPEDPTKPEVIEAKLRMEEPLVLNAVEKMQSFFKAGYIDPDLAIDGVAGTTLTEAWNSGNYLVSTRNTTPLFAEDASAVRGIEVKEGIMSRAIVPSSAQGAGHAISIYSRYKDESMQLLNAMYTDEELHTLMAYGVEGEHWTGNSNGTLTKTEKGIAEYNPWVLGMSNVNIAKATEAQGPNFISEYVKANESSVAISAIGFVFDPAPVDKEIAALQSVVKEYNVSVYSGAASDANVKAYIKAMEANGVNTVLDEVNKQLAAYYDGK